MGFTGMNSLLGGNVPPVYTKSKMPTILVAPQRLRCRSRATKDLSQTNSWDFHGRLAWLPLHFEVASREPIAWRYWNAPHVSGFRQTQAEQPCSLVFAKGNTVHDIGGDAIPGG